MTATFNDLYRHELEALISAEEQMVALLPRLVKATDTAELKDALKAQQGSCAEQRAMLQAITKALPHHKAKRACHGMKTLLGECEDLLDEFAAGNLRDAVLIAHMQRAEHYKMAAYASAADFAKLLGDRNATEHLEQAAKAVQATSKSLGQIAIQVNAEAYVDTREEKYP